MYVAHCKSCDTVRPSFMFRMIEAVENKNPKHPLFSLGQLAKAYFWNECKDCHWDRYLKRNYGITASERQQMLDAQNGECAICGIRESKCKKRHAVDHCHETGKIRGILCTNCNSAIGKLQDNTELLKKAIAYLEKSVIIKD